MKIIIALGIITGAGFIYLALNEIEYRRKYIDKREKARRRYP